jgi:hypothetical protein
VASFLTYFLATPPAVTANYGELVSPALALPELKSAMLDGSDLPQDVRDRGLRGKWLIVTSDGGACAATCEKKLYSMRQARLILGRDMDRVARVVLLDDDAKPSAELMSAYSGTAWIAARDANWRNALPKAKGDERGRARIYLVDPLGNLFMSYSAEPDIKRMAKDLQRVLKASQIG